MSAAPTYAPIGLRAVAALLDLLALAAWVWATGSYAASRFGGWTPDGSFTIEGGAALLAMAASIAAWLAAYTCFEWWFGGTAGKWAAGVCVTRFDGRRPSFIQAFVRNLLRPLDGFGVYLFGAIFVLLTKKRQRLGDLIARTIVTARRSNPAVRATAMFVALALPFAAFGVTWYVGLVQAASNRWISGGETRLHGEGEYTTGVSGKFGRDAREIHLINEGSAAGKVFHELCMDAVRFTVGKDGSERAGGVFKPGEKAVLLFNLSGIAAEGSTTRGRTRLKARVIDPNGVDVIQPIEHDGEAPAGSRPVPGSVEVDLPEYCLPGQHRLEILIEDLVASRRVRASIPFTVDAAPYEASATLAFRSLHLTEGKDGAPRTNARYPAGGTVWLAFQTTGFRSGNEGAVKLGVEVVVTTEGGESVGNLHLLSVDRKFFYVPRRIPTTANLAPGGLPPGKYVAIVRGNDDVGQQRTEQRVAFTVTQ